MPHYTTFDGAAATTPRAALTTVDDLDLETTSANVLRDQSFLSAVLPYTLGQAKRHREAISLLCVSIDRLAAIGSLHGTDVAETAIQRVAQAILHRLRTSDVVVRLRDDRLIAMLPNAGAADAARLADVLRSVIEDAGTATEEMPALTVSIGIANYPFHAHDAHTLFSAADQATRRAERQGRNRVAAAIPSGVGAMLTVVPCAG